MGTGTISTCTGARVLQPPSLELCFTYMESLSGYICTYIRPMVRRGYIMGLYMRFHSSFTGVEILEREVYQSAIAALHVAM